MLTSEGFDYYDYTNDRSALVDAYRWNQAIILDGAAVRHRTEQTA